MAKELVCTKGGSVTPFSHSVNIAAWGEPAQLLFIELSSVSIGIISDTLDAGIRLMDGLLVAGVSFVEALASEPETARPVAVRSDRRSSGASVHTVGQSHVDMLIPPIAFKFRPRWIEYIPAGLSLGLRSPARSIVFTSLAEKWAAEKITW